jgi:hypothetical protein
VIAKAPPRPRSGLFKLFLWLLILTGIVLGGVLLIERPLAAAVCPKCFGLEQVGEKLFVDKDMPQAMQTKVSQVLVEASERVEHFYGSLKHPPRIIVCSTPACYARVGGEGQAVVVGSYALVIAPEGVRLAPIAQQLAYMELLGRIGMVRAFAGAVPVWFHQGVAALASDDRSYSTQARPHMDQCLLDPGEDLPVGRYAWNREAAEGEQVLYARAACKVDRWMLKNGGSGAISTLLAQIDQGKSFDDLFRD